MTQATLKQFGFFALMGGLFLFALYSNVTLAVRNYHLGQKVSILRKGVDDLSIRDQKIALLNDYYQSASYQEVQARAQLQLKSPAESTLIVQGVAAPTKSLSDQLSQQISEPALASPAPQTNFRRWWQFFFN